MVGQLQASVGQVAEDTRTKQQAPGKAGAEFPTEANDEESADSQIAEQMKCVRMESERGNEPPPLTVEDPCCVGITEGVPVQRGTAEQWHVQPGYIVEGGKKNERRKGRQGILHQWGGRG